MITTIEEVKEAYQLYSEIERLKTVKRDLALMYSQGATYGRIEIIG